MGAEFKLEHTAEFDTLLSPVQRTQVVVLNSGKYPTNDIQFRKVVMHAVNKEPMVQDLLMGLAKSVYQLFPLDTPYCDVDLTPHWDYDLEKATLLNCPAPVETVTIKTEETTTNVVPIVIVAVCLLLMCLLILFMVLREKKGKPVFGEKLIEVPTAEEEKLKEVK